MLAFFPAGEEFNWNSVQAGFTSDARKLFNYTLNASTGGYYNGNRWNVGGLMNYRVQPYGSIGMTMSYNNISLPQPYNSAKLVATSVRSGYSEAQEVKTDLLLLFMTF